MATPVTQKSPILKLYLGALLGCISTLLVINYTSPYVFAIIFPTSIYAVTNTTRQLVNALSIGDTEEIYKHLDDPAQGSQIMNDLTMLVHNEEVIHRYETLYVCDSEFEGKVWENLGVIYYDDTSVRFEIDLIQDAQKTWKVHRFVLLPEFGPGAFGDCE